MSFHQWHLKSNKRDKQIINEGEGPISLVSTYMYMLHAQAYISWTQDQGQCACRLGKIMLIIAGFFLENRDKQIIDEEQGVQLTQLSCWLLIYI